MMRACSRRESRSAADSPTDADEINRDVPASDSTHLRWSFGIILLIYSLVLVRTQPGWARQTPKTIEPNSRPAVVYPWHDPDTAPDRRAMPTPAPLPVVNEPFPDVMVGGVWGFWDSTHHFHRRPGVIDRAATGPTGSHHDMAEGRPAGARTQRVSISRRDVRLQSSPAGRIVAEHSMSRGRR